MEVDPDTAKNIIRYRPTATLPRMPICTPFATIIVQPAKDALRWRYLSEGRTAGSLSGANSFPNHTTYPSIKVVGYTGEAKVVVSCVTDKVGSNNKHK